MDGGESGGKMGSSDTGKKKDVPPRQLLKLPPDTQMTVFREDAVTYQMWEKNK